MERGARKDKILWPWAEGLAQQLKLLSGKCEVLSSVLSTKTEKRKKEILIYLSEVIRQKGKGKVKFYPKHKSRMIMHFICHLHSPILLLLQRNLHAVA